MVEIRVERGSKENFVVIFSWIYFNYSLIIPAIILRMILKEIVKEKYLKYSEVFSFVMNIYKNTFL